MRLNRFLAVLSMFVCAAQLSSIASATTVTQLYTPDLSPNDTKFVDKDAAGTTYAGPSVAFANGNNQLTFSRGSGGFETDKVGYNYGNSAFSNGTVLVGAGGFQGSGDGKAVTITFAVPVIQFGMNIEDFDLAGNGTSNPYFIDFQALDSTGASLGYFTSKAGCSDNTCLSFEGLTVSGDSIKSISFYDSPNNINSSSNNLLFGNIAYANAGTALQAPAPTPEPSSIALLGTGLLSLAAFEPPRQRLPPQLLRTLDIFKEKDHDLPSETSGIRLLHRAAALVAVALLPTARAQIAMRGFYGDLSDTHDTFLSVDLNGDGKADMLYSRPGSGTAGAYLSHGDGTFHYISYVNGGTPQNGFIGDLEDTHDTFLPLDLNGDGKSDFIEYRPGSGDTIRCLSNGDGTVKCDRLSSGGTDYFNFGDSMTNSNTRIVAMNRRGSPSEFLVYTPGGGSAGIYVPQAGSTNLQSINLTKNSTPSRATGWQETMTAGDEHIVPLDINGDGSPDLLVFSPRAGTVHLYRNNGSNGFALFTLAVPGRNSNGFTGNSQDNNARAIALDLDGDGKQDFLWWQAGTKTVIGFLSNGDGTVKAVNYLTGGTPGNGFQDTDSSMGDNAVAVDLNGDGKSDFLWYSPGNSIVTAYTSSSTGALTAASYRTGTGTSQNFQSSSSTQYDTALPLNFLGQAASGFVWYVPGSGTFQAYTYNAATTKLNDYNFHAYPGTFLSDLNWSVASVPLKEIVMPGTHDAVLYDVGGSSSSFQTQWESILDQLSDGARFFDFRVAHINFPSPGIPKGDGGTTYLPINASLYPTTAGFYMYGHSFNLTNRSPIDIINQLENWLANHPQEVIVLDMTTDINDSSAATLAQQLGNTSFPTMIYTQQRACGMASCTSPAVRPQNVTVSQLQTLGSRLILINQSNDGSDGPLAKTGSAWGNALTQVGYCDKRGNAIGSSTGGRSTAKAEIDCIDNGNGDSGGPPLGSVRPDYQAADGASGFMPLKAVLTPFGSYLPGEFISGASPLTLADGADPYGFNVGSNEYDLNNELFSGHWNVNALNAVYIDGIRANNSGGDQMATLIIQRNRQTWVDMHFFNNRADNPAGALSIGANGDIWAAGAKHSLSLFKYNRATATWGAKVNNVPNIKKLAVDPLGGVWVINDYNGIDADTGTLLHFDLNGQNLNTTDSVVRDVAVGKNGSVWAMGVDLSIFEVSGPTDGSADIKASVPTQRGTHLTVDNNGYPWVIDLNGHIQKFNGSSWQQVSRDQGREIAAGVDGSIFITGYNTPLIGRYNVQNNNFDFLLMDADHIAVEPGGQPWAIRHGTGTVYKGSLDQM